MSSEMPRMPDFPTDEHVPKRTTVGRMLIVGFSALVIVGTLGFVSLFYPGFTVVVLLGVLLFLSHYVIWGWWLGPMIRGAAAEETSTHRD